jgi:hypothetical protein
MTKIFKPTHIIAGFAGESPYDDMTEKHVSKKVTIFRRCMNQDTTICETEDGKHLWVGNDALVKL